MTAPRMQLTHDEVVDLAPLYVLGRSRPTKPRRCAYISPTAASPIRSSRSSAAWCRRCSRTSTSWSRPGAEGTHHGGSGSASPGPAGDGAPGVDGTSAPIVRQEAPATAAPSERADNVILAPAAEERFRPTTLSRAVGRAFRIAAVLAIVALGIWNLALWSRLETADQQQAAFLAEVLELARQPGSTTAVLVGETASGLAAVGADGQVPRRDGRSRADERRAGLYGLGDRRRGATPVNIGEFRDLG